LQIVAALCVAAPTLCAEVRLGLLFIGISALCCGAQPPCVQSACRSQCLYTAGFSPQATGKCSACVCVCVGAVSPMSELRRGLKRELVLAQEMSDVRKALRQVRRTEAAAQAAVARQWVLDGPTFDAVMLMCWQADGAVAPAIKYLPRGVGQRRAKRRYGRSSTSACLAPSLPAFLR
jgi:hypothetical protein